MMSAMSSQGQKEEVIEQLILDWGARIGAAAYRENVAPTQLENLITSLDAVSGRDALLVTATFALRQASRRGRGGEQEGEQRQGLGPMTARLVSRALLELYDKGGGKKEALKLLDFAKWVYGALQTSNFSGRPEQITLYDLLKQLTGRR